MSISELLRELQSSNNESDQARICEDIAWELKESEPDKAINYALRTVDLAVKLSDETLLCSSFNTLGTIYKNKGNFEVALEYYYKAIEILNNREESSTLSSVYSNIGVVHALLGNFDKALSLYLKSLKIAEKLGLRRNYININNNLGLLFEQQNDLDKALGYHKISLKEYTKDRYKIGMAYANNNTANIYRRKGELDKATKYYRKALCALEISGERRGMSHSYSRLGEVCFLSKDYSLALDYFYKARQIQEEVQDQLGEAGSLKNIANVYIKQGKVNGALAFSRSSLKLAKKIGAKGLIMESYKSLSDSYTMIDKYKKAYKYHLRHVKVKDAIFNEEKSKAINTLQSRFEAEKKDQKINQLKNEQEFLQRVNEDLKEFTSKASHDLKEPLRMISNFSNLLEKRYSDSLDPTGLEFVSMITSSSRRMSTMLEDLLEFAVAGIKPENLEQIDLNDMLILVQNNLYLKIKETEAVIEATKLPIVISFSTGILQLFQNLISNSIKFTNKDVKPHIKITSWEKDETYTLKFSDNGIGISKKDQKNIFQIFNRIHPKDAFEGTGIGLATCKRIVNNLGGTISLESEEGKGTTFFITFPKNPRIIERRR